MEQLQNLDTAGHLLFSTFMTAVMGATAPIELAVNNLPWAREMRKLSPDELLPMLQKYLSHENVLQAIMLEVRLQEAWALFILTYLKDEEMNEDLAENASFEMCKEWLGMYVDQNVLA